MSDSKNPDSPPLPPSPGAAVGPEEPPPPRTDPNGPKIEAGASALRGSRPTMEDAHTVIDKVSIDGVPPEKCFGFFGVYDGHGGRRCADSTKVHLSKLLF